MITYCIYVRSTWNLSGIPSLDVALSIARDLFRYNWHGNGWLYYVDDAPDGHATSLPVEIARDDDTPEVLVVWLHEPSRRMPVASIVEEHRCPTCGKTVR